MWFSYEDSQTWIALDVAKVKEFMEDNKQGKQTPALQEVAAASQVIDLSGAQPEMIGQAELLEDDKEMEEMRKKRREGQRNDGPRGDRNRNRNDNRNRDNKPGNQQQPRQDRPAHNKPKTGEQPQQPGAPRNENKNRNFDNRNKNRGPRRDNRPPGNNNPNKENPPA
jgi:hypothetical protein